MTNLLAQAFTQRTIRRVVFREDFSRFADTTAFLAAWTADPDDVGVATPTFDLDNTHVVEGETQSARLVLTGTHDAFDRYRLLHTVSEDGAGRPLTPGKSYTFHRQIYSADATVGGKPANQWNTFEATLTADDDGVVTVTIGIGIVTGGTNTLHFWFGDVQLIDPSYPVSPYYQTAFLFEGNRFLGVSRDGLKFDPATERRNIPWDNKPCDIEQADWDTRVEAVVTGRFVQAGQAATYQPGTTTTPGSGVSERLSARESGLFYAAGNYLTNLRMVTASLDGVGFLQVRFPSALCVQYAYASLDKTETEVSATFAARMPLDDAAASHVEAKPYVVELLEAFS